MTNNTLVLVIVLLYIAIASYQACSTSQPIHLGGIVNKAQGSTQNRRAMLIAQTFLNLNNVTLEVSQYNTEVPTFGLPADTPVIIPTGNQLNLTVGAAGSNIEAFNIAQQQFDDGSIGIVGPHGSSDSVYLSSNLLNNIKKPIISYASTSSVLSNKTAHPYFFRVVPPDSQQMEAIVDLCYSMNLNNVGILASSESYGSSGAQIVVSIGATKGIQTYPPELFNPADPSTVRTQLRKLSDLGARTFVVISSSTYSGSSILADADSQNLLTDEYIWIFSETFGAIKDQIQPSNADLYRRAQGIIYMDLGIPVWSKRQYLLNQWELKEQSIKLGNAEDDPVPESLLETAHADAETISTLSTYAAYAYDAVLAFGYAIKDVLTRGECVTDGDALSAAISRVNFLGATGRVAFNANKDRIGITYNVINIRNSYSVIMGRWNTHSGLKWDEDELEKIVLPDGGQSRLDTAQFTRTSIQSANTWNMVPAQGTPPSVRHNYAATVSDSQDSFILFGGAAQSDDPLFNDLWRYDFKSGAWAELYPLGTRPSARREHVSFRNGDKYYIFSGFDGSAYLNDMYEYDLTNSVWSEIIYRSIQIPTPRRRTQVVKYSNKFYLVGGQDAQKENNDVWVFDVATLRWTNLFPTTTGSEYPTPRFSHCLAVYNDFLIVATGRTFASDQQELNDIWVFDLTTRTWRQLTTTNTIRKRYDSTCTVHGTSLYLLAGYSEDEDALDMSDFWSMSLLNISDSSAQFTWNNIYEVIPNHMGRDSMVIMPFSEYLVWFGGWGLNEILNDFWRYSTVTEEIYQVHPGMDTPVASTQQSMVPIGNNMVLYGGKTFDNQFVTAITVYNSDLQMWNTLSVAGTLPATRSGHTAVSKGDQMFIFGGESTTGEYLNDIWMFSLGLNQWTKIEAKPDQNLEQLPSPRSLHVASSNTTHMFIFGGKTKTSALQDVWSFSFDTQSWNLLAGPAVSNVPAQVIGCKSVMLNQKDLLVSGCIDSGDAPSTDVYLFDTRNIAWSIFGSLPTDIIPTTGHTLVRVTGDHLYWFGGRIYTDLNNVMYRNSNKTFSVVNYDVLNAFPDSREGHSGLFYGEKMLIYGGTGTVPGRKAKVANTIFNQLWSYRVGPVCSNFTGFSDPSTCYPCSPGTMEYKGQCVSCPRGQFNDKESSTECYNCPQGFYGLVDGAQTRELCLPCSFGTYNDQEGQADCKPCGEDQVCPIGTKVPLTEEQAEQLLLATQPYKEVTQPTPMPSEDLFIRRVTIFSFVCAGAAAGVVSIAILVIWFATPSLSPYLQMIDLFYSAAHNSELTIMQKKKTEIGGIFSVLALVLVIAVLITEICTYTYNNRLETRSLIPNLSIQNNEVVNSTVNAQITMVGYNGACTVPGVSNGTWGDCAPGISVQLQHLMPQNENSTILNSGNKFLFRSTNSSLDSTSTQCMHVEEYNEANIIKSQCIVDFICRECYFNTGQDSAEIKFLVTEDGSYCDGYRYKISTSTGYLDSSYRVTPPSKVEGRIYSDPSKFYRGTIVPTLLQLQTVQTTFVVTDKLAKRKTGFHIDYRDMTDGDQVDFRTFNHRNGVLFTFRLLKTQYALEIVRYPKRTWMTLITDILAQFTGLLAGVGAAMGIFELLFNQARAVHNQREEDTPYVNFVWYIIMSILVQLPVISSCFKLYGPDPDEFTKLDDEQELKDMKVV